MQNEKNVVILYEFNKKWRVIWTDGRKLPANAEDPSWSYLPDLSEPRWWGYSVGKWIDDYTFEAESNGFNERTWLDNAGRPHSGALHVIERYHRVDAKHLEMSIIIDDPKYYTKAVGRPRQVVLTLAIAQLRFLRAGVLPVPEQGIQ